MSFAIHLNKIRFYPIHDILNHGFIYIFSDLHAISTGMEIKMNTKKTFCTLQTGRVNTGLRKKKNGENEHRYNRGHIFHTQDILYKYMPEILDKLRDCSLLATW